jgi:hypothetical protein
MGSASRLQEIAEAYSGQLDAYASAVEAATAKKVLEKWLFLPLYRDGDLCRIIIWRLRDIRT